VQIPRQFCHNVLGMLVTVMGNFIYNVNLMIVLKLLGWGIPEADVPKIRDVENVNVVVEDSRFNAK
jgi:hypothetical protein